jgi:hypothetical protein
VSLCAANAIGAAGAVALASALPTALTSLILSSTPCHAMRCADSYGYALRFGSSGCGGPGAVRLFAANELGAAGATALALVLGSMSQLTYLDLGGDLAHVAERMNLGTSSAGWAELCSKSCAARRQQPRSCGRYCTGSGPAADVRGFARPEQ